MTDIFDNGNKLPLIEEFYSLQGEGYNTGKAAYFIRIGGCDICCSWCDSKISWNANEYEAVPVETIVAKAEECTARAVVVTGGEPLQYNLTVICNLLKKKGFETFIETAGTNTLTGTWDWICLSPKKHNPPTIELFEKAHELKVVIYNKEDLIWAEECSHKVSDNCKLFLQPEWSKYNSNIEFIVEYIKKNPKWRISLQAHKFMHIP